MFFCKAHRCRGLALWVFAITQVVAPGGCTLQSSRLDLLPCLCGGGGTIFSRVHRRLVVANRLSSIIAAAAATSLPKEAEGKKHYCDPEKSCQKGRQDYAGEPMAGPEAAEPAEILLETPSAEGGSTGTASGLDAVALLSVQPTPLPVPLYAPTVTLAVEAAVVTFGGFDGRANADIAQPETATAKPVQKEAATSEEAKVVVGSLLLHGGTRGASAQWTRRQLPFSFFRPPALSCSCGLMCLLRRVFIVFESPPLLNVNCTPRLFPRIVLVAALQVLLSTYSHPSTCMQQRAAFV